MLHSLTEIFFDNRRLLYTFNSLTNTLMKIRGWNEKRSLHNAIKTHTSWVCNTTYFWTWLLQSRFNLCAVLFCLRSFFHLNKMKTLQKVHTTFFFYFVSFTLFLSSPFWFLPTFQILICAPTHIAAKSNLLTREIRAQIYQSFSLIVQIIFFLTNAIDLLVFVTEVFVWIIRSKQITFTIHRKCTWKCFSQTMRD